MKNKNNKILMFGIVGLLSLFLVIGVSYAVWSLLLKQTGENIVNTSCFKVEFSDLNPIELNKAYPITDDDGKKLTPYEFTITNTCENYASYQINLEILDTTTLEDLSIIKIDLENEISLISSKETTSKTLTNATTSYKLQTGYLNVSESKTFHLRLWMDEDTPPNEEYMNKVFKSKVTVITSYLNDADTEIPVANFTTTKSDAGIVVDASSSTDNKGIAKYYYSTDGTNFTSSTESSYTFSEGAIEYGVGTNTITKLYSTKVNKVYVQVEDEMGNKSEVIQKIVGELVYDETEDNNLRYIGASPNNYVSFNNELWRIIGVMNNIDDGTGKKETRIKIIRNEAIGSYSWDTSESNVNIGYGVNEWSQSDVMKLLNPNHETEIVGGSLYWNKGNGTCYNGRSNATTTCDFTSTGLMEDAMELIGEAVWHTGSNGTEASCDNILTSKFYELERSSNTGKICTSGTTCNDNVSRTTTWTGYIGLMTPSDYGYATSGGTRANRTTCLNTVLYNWDGSEVTDCKTNDWLHSSSTNQWTITPFASSASVSGVFFVFDDGRVHASYADSYYAVSPSIFLKSNVKITSGEGTEIFPFILSEE